MCGAACILNKDVTMPAPELLSSRCLTRPLKHYTTHRVGAQHYSSFKIQMWETKRTPPVGDKKSDRKRQASARRKTSLHINPVIRKRAIKRHLGSLFRFYKLAGSCLLLQHPCSAKLQHLQVFQVFINQLLEHLL